MIDAKLEKNIKLLEQSNAVFNKWLKVLSKLKDFKKNIQITIQ